MSEKSSRKKILLALLLATIAAAAVYWFLGRGSTSESPDTTQPQVQSSQVTVLVTTRDIAPGETLGEDDVALQEIPVTARHPRALVAPSEAIGKVSASAMVEGEQVLDVRLAPTALPMNDTFASGLRPGYRAITLSADEIMTVGGLAQPGDHADVVAYFTMNVEGDQPADAGAAPKAIPVNVAAVIAQDVEVFAIAQDLTPSENNSQDLSGATTTDGTAIGSDKPVSRPTAASVTLMVTPEQATRLMMAVNAVPQQGALRLVLRAPGDGAHTVSTTAQFDGLVDGTVPNVDGLLDDLVEPAMTSPLVITDAAFEEQAVTAGQELKFAVTVKNVSTDAIPAGTGGAPSGFSYTQGEAYDALGFVEQDGNFRIAIGVEGADAPAFPYRWALDKPLAPGESTTITGKVLVKEPSPGAMYWFALVQEPNAVLIDGVAPVMITVLPVPRVKVTASATPLLSAPRESADIVREIPQGSEFRVVTQIADWYQVEDGGLYGWLRASEVEPMFAPRGVSSEPAGATPVAVEGAGS